MELLLALTAILPRDSQKEEEEEVTSIMRWELTSFMVSMVSPTTFHGVIGDTRSE